MEIEKSLQIEPQDNIVMIVYGKAGVGKTTFAASAPNALVIDFENGSKFLGQRGISVDVVRMKEWFTESEKKELWAELKNYDSIIIDPLGEAMDKLIHHYIHKVGGPMKQSTRDALSMAGWGEVKKEMRNFIKALRDTGKNIIIVAHDAEDKDNEEIIHRIQVATKLSDEIPNMVDIISYMAVSKTEKGARYMLYTPRQAERFDSKDRTGRVPDVVDVGEKTGFQDFIDSWLPITEQPIY